MTGPQRAARGLFTVAMIASAAMLSGCADGVELKGGVFDAMGISTSALVGSKTDEKVAVRPGLVIPPSMDRLPPPGTEAAPAQQAEAFPVDPEQRAKQKQADLENQQKEFCENAAREARVRNSDGTLLQGPTGTCNQSALTNAFSNKPQIQKQ